MNAIVPHAQAVANSFGSGMIPKDMDQAMRLATAMANAKMVPTHLQNDVGSCLMIVDQAMRWQISPFAVAQCTSNIKGKLMYEGKLIAGVAVSCGAITGDFDYEYTGDPKRPETLSVKATATRASDRKVWFIDLAWKDAKTDNPLWTKQPEQQLAYAVVRVWVRRYTPSVLLGVYVPEEFNRDAPADTFAGTTLDAKAETPDEAAPKRKTIGEWLDALETELQAATDAQAVDAIIYRMDVQKAMDSLRNGAMDRLKVMIEVAQARTAAATDEPVDDHDLDHANALLKQFNDCQTDVQVITLTTQREVKDEIADYKKRRPDLHKMLIEGIDAKRKALNNPDGGLGV